MKYLWLLTKVSLGSIFSFNKLFEKKKQKQNIVKILGIVVVIILALTIVASVYLYVYGIGTILVGFNLVDILPGLMMALVCVLVTISTMSRVKGTLFAFKDFDLVMSLPIDHNIIVASRLFALYIINLAFSLIVMIPSNTAYAILTKPGLLFHIYSLILIPIIPIIPMIIGTVLGTIIIYISSKIRHSNLVNIFLNIILVVGILVISIFTSNSEEAIGTSTAFIADQVNKIYPLAEMYSRAAVDKNLVSLLIFIGISLIFYLAYIIIIGRRFIEINTSIMSVHTVKNRKERKYSVSSPFLALLKKELSRYFSSAVYVLNTSFGMIFLLLMSGATLFVKNDALDQMLDIPGFTSLAGSYLPIGIPFFITLVYASACSISLEGNNLWIIKSSPVSTKQIFHSKIALNLTIILPATFLSIVFLAIGLKLELQATLLTLIMAIAYAFLTSIAGLLTNLIFPVFNWKAEVTVIKQSLSSMIAVLGGMVVALIPIGAQYLLRDYFVPNIINLMVIGLITLATIILYGVLMTKGRKMFVEL